MNSFFNNDSYSSVNISVSLIILSFHKLNMPLSKTQKNYSRLTIWRAAMETVSREACSVTVPRTVTTALTRTLAVSLHAILAIKSVWGKYYCPHEMLLNKG